MAIYRQISKASLMNTFFFYFGCYNFAVISNTEDQTTWIRSGFQLSVVKPKPKQLLWSIATDVNNTTSQSEFKANTWNWHQARENAIAFGLDSHWLRKWREFSISNCKPKQTRNYFGHSIENRSVTSPIRFFNPICFGQICSNIWQGTFSLTSNCS